MLEDFALETFVGLVGEVFRVTLDDGSMLELRLASAVASPSRPNAETGPRPGGSVEEGRARRKVAPTHWRGG